MRIWVERGIICNIEPINNFNAVVSTWIGPGLVDLQVNGYSGIDFNTLPLSEEMIIEVTKALWQEGVTSYFPTIITNSDTVIEKIINTFSSAINANPILGKTIKGIHLEGPFISPEDGPRGAHPREYVKPPDWDLFKKWQKAAKGRIKLITLSPEWTGSAEFTAKCVAEGVKVAIGHTDASSKQIFEVLNAGASLSTHLGNGSHTVLPRHPNYIWDQLAEERLWASIIADGFHLPDSVLKVIYKVKQNRVFLVSDSVYLAGLKAGEYETHIGGKVVLTPEGKLHLKENPKFLAGSVKSLRQCIEYLNDRLLPFQEAWEMASLRPSTFMKFDTYKGLEIGAPADLVLFERYKSQIKILQTYKFGKLVYSLY
ncbi:MAG: N-acetylglucosamine-6-phosphate deacetylase [Thermoanaerobacteraceae bacterium]